MNQIGIDQISDIGEICINPKSLTCSICYCLNINARECMNKKCQKLFCFKCASANVLNSQINQNQTKIRKNVCPFCRLEIDFTIADETLIKTINNLKFFTLEFACDKKLNLEEYIEYFTKEKIGMENKINLKNKNTNYFCKKCKIYNVKRPLLKCGICFNLGCYGSLTTNDKVICNYIEKCFNCKLPICENCNTYTSSKLNKEVFLCGMCNVMCKECNNNEAKGVCSMCMKCLCTNCGKVCEDCMKFVCVDSVTCYKNKVNSCNDCNSIPVSEFYNKCAHINYIKCETCYLKCKISNCSNFSAIQCKHCKQGICIKNCSMKCKSCKDIICINCAKFCMVCKNYNCQECLTKCDKCDSNVYSCRDCNMDSIRKCNYSNCEIKLCLNCWNVCNYCNVIYCQDHSVTCINCDEQCCLEHYNNCETCNNSKEDSKYRKLCLKKCTYKCSFCDIVTNVLCNKNKHKGNIVKTLNCDHNVCSNCLKQCAKCNNVVVSCPKCIVNYYFHLCKYCNAYMCSTCSRFCSKCEDVYCTSEHRCLYCKKPSNSQCLNCLFNIRIKCCSCSIKLEQCVDCAKQYICSINCYLKLSEYSFNKLEGSHLCKMYTCGSNCNEFNIESIKYEPIKEKPNAQNNNEIKIVERKNIKKDSDKSCMGCSRSCLIY